MTPNVQILADSQDVSRAIKDRLISLRVTDEPGWQSDSLEITLDDHDSQLELPRHGAQLEVHMGYKETGLVLMGVYTVDEVSLEGPADALTIRARAANFRSSLKEQKTRAWEDVTLSDVIKTIAGEHGLEPVISETLAKQQIQRMDQTDESDLHFLTRLAKEYGAIGKPVNNRLLFVPRSESRSASNKPMTLIPLTKTNLTSYRFSLADRGKYEAVIAHWYDNKKAKQIPVKAGKQQARPIYTLKGLHPDAEAAKTAAQSKLAALRRGQATGSLTLPGNAQLGAEVRVQLTGIKERVDGDWVVTRAEHELSTGGFTTRLSIETPAV